jgi:hypothetical protein
VGKDHISVMNVGVYEEMMVKQPSSQPCRGWLGPFRTLELSGGIELPMPARDADSLQWVIKKNESDHDLSHADVQLGFQPQHRPGCLIF